MNAVPMIRACHFYQNPSDYGRDLINYPNSDELGPCCFRSPEGNLPVVVVPDFSTWCPRCECDHGDPPRILEP